MKNIDSYIEDLNDIALGGIEKDSFDDEFDDVKSILEAIKIKAKNGEATKKQLKEIISFLNFQSLDAIGSRLDIYGELRSYQEDYEKLLKNYNKEVLTVKKDTRKNINNVIDTLKSEGVITEENNYKESTIKKNIRTKPQINFDKSGKKSFEDKIDLTNLTSYTVKSGDNLWNIVKKQYPKLTKTNKDIIHIVNYIVNFNIKNHPSKLKHLERDDKLAWGKNGSDGIAGDTLRVGDVLDLPNIKIILAKPIVSKESVDNTPIVDIKKPIINTPPVESSEIKQVETTSHYIFKDGRVFLIGEDGTKFEQTQELTKEQLKLIENHKKIGILNEVLEIWKTEANNVVKSLFWKDSRHDDEIILNQVSGINNNINTLFESLKSGKVSDKEINTSIDNIFSKIQIAENEESIIGSDDMKEVKSILLSNTLSKDEKLIKVFNLMRYKGLSGNSNTVKEKVANHLLVQPEFKSISDILKNKELLPYIKNSKKSELTKLIGNKEFADEIIDSYKKNKVKQEKNRENYSKILEPINKERVRNKQKEIKLDDFIQSNIDYSMQTLVKHKLIENQIDEMTNRGNEDTYTGLYANMSGMATRSVGDIWIIADDNIDTAIDIGTTLAISAISMGVGALAARGAMLGIEYGATALEVGQATSRAGKLARFAGTAGVEGTSFYEGTTISHNLIYSNEWNKNTANFKEITKSIAFMGVLRGFNNLVKEASIARVISKSGAELDMGLSGNMLSKLGFFTQSKIATILLEAGIITSTSVGLEVAFEGEGNFTLEEYLQALVMVGLFRGVGKIKFSKGPNNEIKADVTTKKGEGNKKETSNSTSETTSQNEVYIHENGKEYTKGADGKFRDSKGAIRNVSEKKMKRKYTGSTEAPIDKNAKPINSDGTLNNTFGARKILYKGPDGQVFEKKVFDGENHFINQKGFSETISGMKEKLKNAKLNDDGKNAIFTKNIKKLEAKIKYYESLKFIKPKFNQKTIDKNKGLNESERINESEKLLGRKLSKEEQKAIIDAHNIDYNKGNLRNIKDKVILLEKFSKEERRILLDSGLCGKTKNSELAKETKEPLNVKEKIKKLSDTKIIKYLSNLKGWEDFKKFPLPKKKALIKFLKSMAISGTLSVAIHETFTEWDPGISKMQRIKELALVFLSGAALGGTFIFAQKGIYSAWIVSKGGSKVVYQGVIKPIVGNLWKHKVAIGLTGFAGYTSYNLIQKP